MFSSSSSSSRPLSVSAWNFKHSQQYDVHPPPPPSSTIQCINGIVVDSVSSMEIHGKACFSNPFCDPYVKHEDVLTYSKYSQRNKKEKKKELQLDAHRSTDNNNNSNFDIPSDYVYHTISIFNSDDNKSGKKKVYEVLFHRKCRITTLKYTRAQRPPPSSPIWSVHAHNENIYWYNRLSVLTNGETQQHSAMQTDNRVCECWKLPHSDALFQRQAYSFNQFNTQHLLLHCALFDNNSCTCRDYA